jgi:hypothetical protein
MEKWKAKRKQRELAREAARAAAKAQSAQAAIIIPFLMQ